MNYTIKFPDGYTKPLLPGRDLWTSALRSGGYQQGIGALSDDGFDCCLGVLCKVQNRPAKNGNEDTAFNGMQFDNDNLVLTSPNPLFLHLNKSGNFPRGVTVISTPDPDTHPGREGGVHGSLACCNDNHLTFLQIADIIEAVWDAAEPNWTP